MLNITQLLERSKSIKEVMDAQIECKHLLALLEQKDEVTITSVDLPHGTTHSVGITFILGSSSHQQLVVALRSEVFRLEALLHDILHQTSKEGDA